MNREFLEQLGLEKDAVDKVMAEHGKAVNATKTELTEAKTTVETLQEQLNQRNADIEELRKQAGSIEELQGKLKELQNKYESETQELQGKLTQAKLDAAVELALTKNGARNNKAVRALLNAEELELSDDGVKGLDDQLNAVKEENPYLFGEAEEEKKPRFSKPGNPTISGNQEPQSLQDAIAQELNK
ncbi:phage scaffolding protein [Atopococcus tabaci]|uniref:phage scaffolding protein n=1 Tax=Atopococcus tabaci TaxID=269774 RepID=UPI002409B3E2|nr:phage scaffolding protein [Atopococcus tabaci]